MLPDFPEIRKRYAEILNRAFAQRKLRALGVFGEIREVPVHEGNRSVLVRPDGRKDETHMQELTVESKLVSTDRTQMSDAEVLENFMQMADQIAEKQSLMTIEAIDKAVSSVGNVSTCDTIGPQNLIDALEKMEIQFGPDGKHDNLTIVSGSAMEAHLQAALQLIDSDPFWKAKYNNMMERKRGEWNARESSRKLVG